MRRGTGKDDALSRPAWQRPTATRPPLAAILLRPALLCAPTVLKEPLGQRSLTKEPHHGGRLNAALFPEGSHGRKPRPHPLCTFVMENSAVEVPCPAALLAAYSKGLTPIVIPGFEDQCYWIDKTYRTGIFVQDIPPCWSTAPYVDGITFNENFEQLCDLTVIQSSTSDGQADSEACLEAIAMRLHDAGHGYSVEAWRNGNLVGEIYGVRFFGVFIVGGYSPTHGAIWDICLSKLAEQLGQEEYHLMILPRLNVKNLASDFKIQPIPKKQYRKLLEQALSDWEDDRNSPIGAAEVEGTKIVLKP